MLRGFGFRLRKWYLDCVAPDGTAFIGYAARIGVGPLPISYQAALLCPATGAARTAHSLWPAALPLASSDSLRWQNGRLGVHGSWRGERKGGRHRLLDGAELLVEWRCHMPSADAHVRCGDVDLSGRGYAEELILQGSPARLPIRELHWGRFADAEHDLVWIEWRGPAPLRLVLLDGAETAATRVETDGVEFTGGSLALAEPRELRVEAVGRSVFGDAPRLRRLLPGSVADWQEEKWLSRAELRHPSGVRREGWAIHERVRWP